MFENLTDKLQSIFDGLSRQGKLTENDVNLAMREVRMALLEADVNFKVVKEFIERVKGRAVGAEVMNSLTPAQQVVKIVNEELIQLLGEPAPLNLSGQPPQVVMLVGLQGARSTSRFTAKAPTSPPRRLLRMPCVSPAKKPITLSFWTPPVACRSTKR